MFIAGGLSPYFVLPQGKNPAVIKLKNIIDNNKKNLYNLTMKDKLYIETSIISYLTSKPSRDIIIAAHQQITYNWWSTHRDEFDLFTSQFVIDEAEAGDPEAAKKRLFDNGFIAPIICTPEELLGE